MSNETKFLGNCEIDQPTRFSSSTSATVTTSTSFKLASLHARVTSIKSTKRDGVSQSVSQILTRVANAMIGLGSNKNIKLEIGVRMLFKCL